MRRAMPAAESGSWSCSRMRMRAGLNRMAAAWGFWMTWMAAAAIGLLYAERIYMSRKKYLSAKLPAPAGQEACAHCVVRYSELMLAIAAKGVFISLTAAAFAYAQPPRLVSLDISASDSKGRFVPDLSPSELRLSDAGHPQPIMFFRRGDTLPHGVAVLIDQFNGDREQQGTEWSKILRAASHTESAWDAFLYVLTPSGALYPILPMPDSWAGWTP